MRSVALGKLASALLLAGLSSVSHAAVIVNNGVPNQSGGANMNGFREADDFTVAGPTQIQQIRFWSLQGSAADYSGSISWSICGDASGAPGASCTSGSSSPAGAATGNSALGLVEYVYEFATNVLLQAGNYWLVLQNGSNAAQAGDFYWAFADDTQGNSQSLELAVADPQWTGNLAELAFQLEGERVAPPGVPEPGSLLLAATALAAAFVRRRTSTRSAA
jgi:hypothetical protein